jgi:hypothetical protein
VAETRETNVELVLRGFTVFNEGGPEAFVDLLVDEDRLHTDFLFHIQDDLPNGGDWKGIEGFREMNRHWLEPWEEFTIKPLEVTEGPGGDVMLQVEQRALARGSGMEITGRGFLYVILYRDGKLAEMHLLTDRERAEKLAGLAG